MIPNSGDSLCRKVRRIILSSDEEFSPDKDSGKALNTSSNQNSNAEAEFTGGESDADDHHGDSYKIRSVMHDYISLPNLRSKSSHSKSATSIRPTRASALTAKQRLKYICKDENGSIDYSEQSKKSPEKRKLHENNSVAASPDSSSSKSSSTERKVPLLQPQSGRKSERHSKLNQLNLLKRQDILKGLHDRYKSGIDGAMLSSDEEYDEGDEENETMEISYRKEAPRLSLFGVRHKVSRKEEAEEDEYDRGGSDIDDFIVHSSEEDELESIKKKSSSHKHASKKKKMKSVGQEPSAPKKLRRRIVEDEEEEEDQDEENEEEEEEEESGEEQERDEGLLYLQVNARREEQLDQAPPPQRRSFPLPQALALYLRLLGHSLLDPAFMPQVTRTAGRELHSCYLGAARQIENLICTSRESLLGSSAGRADFLQPLASRPFFAVTPAHSACGLRCMACGRSSQRPEHRVHLFGGSYDARQVWSSARWDRLMPAALFEDLPGRKTPHAPSISSSSSRSNTREAVPARKRRLVVLLDEDEEEEEEEEEKEEVEEEEEEQVPRRVPWWRRRWPQSLVREAESSWELAAHCRARSQLYHTLLHYKLRLLLKIKELLQREGLQGGVDDLHRRLDLLLNGNSKFLQAELGRLQAVLQQAMVRWGSRDESLPAADVWGDGDPGRLPAPQTAPRRPLPPTTQGQGSLSGWLSGGQTHAKKPRHCSN